MSRLGKGRLGGEGRGLDAITLAAVLVMIAGTYQAFAGALNSGVTTDEPTQLNRTQSWLTDGWYVPETFLVDGEPSSDPTSSPYVYGPASGALAHAANVVVGNEEWNEVAADESAWDVRHLVVAAIGVFTAALVGVGVWLLSGSVRWGVWGAAALLAIPLWTGMSFFNVKDVPAAAGYTSFTVGLMLAFRSSDEGRRRSSRTSLVDVPALVCAGMILGAGTRIALWAAFAASLFTFATLCLLRRWAKTGAWDRRSALAVGIGLGVGVMSLVALYPKAFGQPLDLLSQSLSISSDYPYTGFTLTAGQLLPENPPLWYLPAWGFASTPVLILAFGVTAVGAGAWRLVATLRERGWADLLSLSGRRELAVLLVLQQALLLPVAAILLGSTMYSGLRQHLYVVPAIAILSGLGASWVWTRVSAGGSSLCRGAAMAGLVAALAVPMIEQSVLFPYNYTYVNPIAGLSGVNGQWESDFWGSSMREALSRLPPGAEPMCSSLDSPANPESALAFAPCSPHPGLSPYLDEREGSSVPGDSRQWVISYRRAANSPPGICEEVDNVTRWLRGEGVIMSYVLRCDEQPIP